MKLRQLLFLIVLIAATFVTSSCADWPAEYYVNLYFYFEDDSTERNISYQDSQYCDKLMPYDSTIGLVSKKEDGALDISDCSSESSEWSTFFEKYESYEVKPTLYSVCLYHSNSRNTPYSVDVTISYKEDGVEHKFAFTNSVPGLEALASYFKSYDISDSVSSSGAKLHVIVRAYQDSVYI
ncbi:MAG: hypothetical protein WCQ67_06860 [Treponema sp.]